MKRVLELFVVIFIFNQCFAYADFIKPSAKIKPEEVIKIQLNGEHCSKFRFLSEA